LDVVKLSKAMTEIHAQVAEKATRDRKAAIEKHNDRTHVRSPNFQVGYYVIVAEHHKSGTSKLQIKWKCPRRVASVDSDYVFEKLSNAMTEIHAQVAEKTTLDLKAAIQKHDSQIHTNF
jgi:hypothetical protein